MELQVKTLKPDLFCHIENEGYIQVRELKKGDVIYECEEGVNMQLEVITDVKRTKSVFYFKVKDLSGDIHDVIISRKHKNFHHLYNVPQFLTEKNGKYFYLVS